MSTPTFSDTEELLAWATTHYEPQALAQGASLGAASDVAESLPAAASAGTLKVAPGALKVVQRDRVAMATFTPPQTRSNPVAPTCGAHCLVVDVSYSMEAAATVKSVEGDSIDHGFTMLDIAKHAMCTYVASLCAGDYVCIACYASEARQVIEWTPCTDDGKSALFEAIKDLKEEGSTNLTAGIATGMRAFEALPPAVAAAPTDYALLLAIATDGQPSNDTHPPGGPPAYPAFVHGRMAAVAAAHGAAAVPALVAIGLGNDLDSRLLSSFSDHFLHIPDPGSVGPFMVNLLAATRATARIATCAAAGGAAATAAAGAADLAADLAVDISDDPGSAPPTAPRVSSAVANRAVLRLSPASAVAAVPGHASSVVDGEVHVALGALIYDQPRHVIVHTVEGAGALASRVTVGDGSVLAACAAPSAVAEGAEAASFAQELGRTAAVCALELQERRLGLVDGLGAPQDEVAARLAREGGRFGDVTISLVWNDESDLDLHVTVPSGETLSYNHKKGADGLTELDIDMNAGGVKSKEPVENVFAGDAEKGIEAPRGTYKVRVHNYGYHSSEGLAAPRPIPFKVSVRMHGDVTEYTGTLRAAKEWADVATFEYTGRLDSANAQTLLLQEQKRKREADKERLRGVPTSLLEQATALLPDAAALKTTLTSEALLAAQPDKYATWGRHYLVTLPQMLRAERRSNFRDAALQAYGHDAAGHEAFFESLSSEAELCFAQLAPPQPSGLERLARKSEAAANARVVSRQLDAMPEEFMRGGGCFAPEALVRAVVRADAADDDESATEADEEVDVPIARLVAGARVRTASGGAARVRCVVVSPCAGGVTTLTRMPSGLQLTEWHPLLDSRGTWRFPNMLGQQVRRTDVPAVYNLVLESEHVAMIGGMPCATLGHGLVGPVIGHPFWGTRAVLDELAAHPGWASGRVVLDAPLRASHAAAVSVV